jgi:hypothetical protein
VIKVTFVNIFISGKKNSSYIFFRWFLALGKINILFVRWLFSLWVTGLYKIRGAWRSVRLEAAKPTNIFFSSKLTEPRANQHGKRVLIFRKVQVTNICSN